MGQWLSTTQVQLRSNCSVTAAHSMTYFFQTNTSLWSSQPPSNNKTAKAIVCVITGLRLCQTHKLHVTKGCLSKCSQTVYDDLRLDMSLDKCSRNCRHSHGNFLLNACTFPCWVHLHVSTASPRCLLIPYHQTFIPSYHPPTKLLTYNLEEKEPNKATHINLL